MNMETRKDVLGCVGVQARICLICTGIGHLTPFPFDTDVHGQKKGQGLGEIHRVVIRHESDNGSRPDLAELPALALVQVAQSVTLGIVEDVGGVGLWYPGRRLFERRVEGDAFTHELVAIRFGTRLQGPKSHLWAQGVDCFYRCGEQTHIRLSQSLEVFFVASICGEIDVGGLPNVLDRLELLDGNVDAARKVYAAGKLVSVRVWRE